MFGIKSQGEKNFAACQVKELSAPGGSSAARLDCAVTSETGFSTNAESNKRNLKHLARTVGNSMCDGCLFAGMSQAEYFDYQTEATEAETRLIMAQQARDATAAGEVPINTAPTPQIGSGSH